MTVGLSTYAFFWQWHDTATSPLSLTDMIEKTPSGTSSCSRSATTRHLTATTTPRSAKLRRHAERRRDPRARHPRRHPEPPRPLLAHRRVARRHAGPQHDQHRRPPTDVGGGGADCSRESTAAYEAAGVTLALETYEQVPSATLVGIVRAVDSPTLGICLDPANCVAALEHPRDTIELTAPYVRQHPRQGLRLHPAGRLGRVHLRRRPLGDGLLDYDHLLETVQPDRAGHQPDHRALAALAGRQPHHRQHRGPVDAPQSRLPKEQAIMTDSTKPNGQLTIAVIGAGGKMGMRVSNNLQRSDHAVFYGENSPAGQQRTRDAGREVTDTATAVADAACGDPCRARRRARPGLGRGRPAAEAGHRSCSPSTRPPPTRTCCIQRDDVEYAVAHPCHPSVFLQRKTEAELNDTFGGIAAPQDVVAALESGNQEKITIAEAVIRLMYAPVIDVHWVTVKQLAYLEPTLVEVVACMIGDLLNEALRETVNTVGVPEAAAAAMLLGHIQVALANGLRGDNPFSDACLIAMDYGRSKIIKDDWKSIFDDDELDHVLKQMLHLDRIHR